MAGTWPSNFVRQHLQQHQVQQQHVVQGFVEFIQRHTVNLLLLCMDTPPTQQDNLTTLHIKAHEFSRLHFLLDPGPGVFLCGVCRGRLLVGLFLHHVHEVHTYTHTTHTPTPHIHKYTPTTHTQIHIHHTYQPRGPCIHAQCGALPDHC